MRDSQGGIHQLAMRVYYEDTDAGGVVYHARYLHFAERARTEWLRHGWPQQSADLRAQGMAFVVHQLTMTYHRPARLDDWLWVNSWVDHHRPSRLTMTQQIYRGDTHPMGTASAGKPAIAAGAGHSGRSGDSGDAGNLGNLGDAGKTLLASLSVTLALVRLDDGRPQRLPNWLVGG
ncbi:MAG: YbgC/FadM family acyl-CoA thioesterase [Alphaproteobacteria bacterium]|nr:YbgC/FadM family acyl-CoA thioesterase [Alphaproteobacteria bacterium]